MIITVFFLILSLLSAASLAVLIIMSAFNLIAGIRRKQKPVKRTRLIKTAIIFAVVAIMNLGLIVFSQLTASTPQIVDENGNVVLDKYVPRCVFCDGAKENIINFKGKTVCKDCIIEM